MRRTNSNTLRSLAGATAAVEENTKMEAFQKLQPRIKTQLPVTPRLYASNNLKQGRNNWCFVVGVLIILCFFFYLLSVARGVQFSSHRSGGYGIIIDGGSTGSRIYVFEYVNEGRGRLPIVSFPGKGAPTLKTKPGLSAFASRPERAGDSILELLNFAKQKVPETYRSGTKIHLMATAGLRRLKEDTRERILESCRRILRSSGFGFRDNWASVITGADEGIFAWVAANYALGTLGGNPHKTTGIIELGGASFQVTFVPEKLPDPEDLHSLILGGVTYDLYSQSFLHFGQEAAWEGLLQMLVSGAFNSYYEAEKDATAWTEVKNKKKRVVKQPSHHMVLRSQSKKVEKGVVVDPCTPKGYTMGSEELLQLPAGSVNTDNGKISAVHSRGNFSECRNAALGLLSQGQGDTEECTYFWKHCKTGKKRIPELHGKFFATENFVYTSQFFGLVPRASLSHIEKAGEQYCGEDWAVLQQKHHDVDKEDLLKYCFSSAYIVALLNDSLGIAMNDERVRFANQVGTVPIDWALGAFILRTIEDLSSTQSSWILGEDSFTFFSSFAILVLLGLAAWSLSRWRKPNVKTIYDLEKGRYITTAARVHR